MNCTERREVCQDLAGSIQIAIQAEAENGEKELSEQQRRREEEEESWMGSGDGQEREAVEEEVARREWQEEQGWDQRVEERKAAQDENGGNRKSRAREDRGRTLNQSGCEGMTGR